MPIDLKMPALSPTMETGTLARWLVAVGDLVSPGDLLAEIETDKATMEFEAVDEGRVARLVVDGGTDDIAVGTVIAVLAEVGETGVAAASETNESDTPAADAPVAAGPAGDVPANATPLARSIAVARNLPLSGITGSGAGGRITIADLGPLAWRTASAKTPSVACAPTAPPPIPPAQDDVPVTAVDLSGLRTPIARRMADTKIAVPDFHLTVRCNVDALQMLRDDLNAGLAPRGITLSIDDMLLKAMAMALTLVPEANVQAEADGLCQVARVDVAMAAAIDGGLATSVVRDAGKLSLSAIAQATRALAEKARDGSLRPEAYRGGAPSLSSLAMFGIDEMVPVRDPSQTFSLGIGAVVEQPRKVNGAMALAKIVAATGSFDRRAIDGVVAARFMATFREHVETPMLMLG